MTVPRAFGNIGPGVVDKNILFLGKGDRAKKGSKSAEYKIFSPLLCQLSYLGLLVLDWVGFKGNV
jgi:hypothetical protein